MFDGGSSCAISKCYSDLAGADYFVM